MSNEQRGVRANIRQSFGKYAEPVTVQDQTAHYYIKTEVFIKEEGTGKVIVIEGQSKTEPLFGKDKTGLLDGLEEQKVKITEQQQELTDAIDAQIAEITALA